MADIDTPHRPKRESKILPTITLQCQYTTPNRSRQFTLGASRNREWARFADNRHSAPIETVRGRDLPTADVNRSTTNGDARRQTKTRDVPTANISVRRQTETETENA